METLVYNWSKPCYAAKPHGELLACHSISQSVKAMNPGRTIWLNKLGLFFFSFISHMCDMVPVKTITGGHAMWTLLVLNYDIIARIARTQSHGICHMNEIICFCSCREVLGLSTFVRAQTRMWGNGFLMFCSQRLAHTVCTQTQQNKGWQWRQHTTMELLKYHQPILCGVKAKEFPWRGHLK